jgi:hypothetical protein
MALQYLRRDDHVVVPEMVLKYQKRKKLLKQYRRESDLHDGSPIQHRRESDQHDENLIQKRHENEKCLSITFRHAMFLLTIID